LQEFSKSQLSLGKARGSLRVRRILVLLKHQTKIPVPR